MLIKLFNLRFTVTEQKFFNKNVTLEELNRVYHIEIDQKDGVLSFKKDGHEEWRLQVSMGELKNVKWYQSNPWSPSASEVADLLNLLLTPHIGKVWILLFTAKYKTLSKLPTTWHKKISNLVINKQSFGGIIQIYVSNPQVFC